MLFGASENTLCFSSICSANDISIMPLPVNCELGLMIVTSVGNSDTSSILNYFEIGGTNGVPSANVSFGLDIWVFNCLFNVWATGVGCQ